MVQTKSMLALAENSYSASCQVGNLALNNTKLIVNILLFHQYVSDLSSTGDSGPAPQLVSMSVASSELMGLYCWCKFTVRERRTWPFNLAWEFISLSDKNLKPPDDTI